MKKIILFLLLPFNSLIAQNTYRAIIKDASTKETLVGATAIIQGTTSGSSSDVNGYLEIKNIPDGKHIIEYKYIGYKSKTDTLVFPLVSSETREILLSPNNEELEEVVVSSTRSSRTIDDIPTRIETIASGELTEKNTMQPANVRMLLTESTGIQTQQTSATSANASIRIQGLDGKYTQLLKDGFPLYSGFSGGLSIVQIPPLDLKRVEIIKGSASTLYGGGAIAGLINFITKDPGEQRELTFLANGNQTSALDLSSFYSQKFKKVGVTVFASRNYQLAYDLNKDGFSDIPQQIRYNLNPKLFFYLSPKSTLIFGINSSFEDRKGGDMRVIAGNPDSIHSYFENNKTNRYSSQIKFENKLDKGAVLTVKNSVGYFDRSILRPNYSFGGKQVSSFSEISLMIPKTKSEWITGINLWTDDFTQTSVSNISLNTNQLITGIFLQNNFKVNEKLVLENGLRADYTNRNNVFLLPRISMMYKFSSKITSRVGVGLGYKTPTIFSEEAETRGFRNIQPIDYNTVKPETSIGGNCDVNYKTAIGEEISFSINQMFFYTRLNSPLILSSNPLPNGNYQFSNANGYVDSKGFETNLKIRWDELAFYTGYTFIDAQINYNGINKINPLTAQHRIYTTLMYEIENKLRIGYELFYTGQQYVSTGEKKPDYWVMGISIEKLWKHFSIFLNAEDFINTRQQRFESMYTGTLQNPQFKEIWAPTDGFIFNGGFKVVFK